MVLFLISSEWHARTDRVRNVLLKLTLKTEISIQPELIKAKDDCLYSILAAHHPFLCSGGGSNLTMWAPNLRSLPFESLFFSAYFTFLSFMESSSSCLLYSASAFILALYSSRFFWISSYFAFSSGLIVFILVVMTAYSTRADPSMRTTK